MNLLGRETFQFSRSTPPGDRAPGLQAAQVGLYNTLATPQGMPLSSMPDRTGEVVNLSGLGQALSMALPLPGYRGQLPSLDAHLYTPGPPATEFHRLFGLRPTGPEVPEPPDKPIRSFPEAIEARTQERLTEVTAEAVDLFRRATTTARDSRTGLYPPECPDCAANLDQALRRLRLVRDLDPQAALPPLLLVHGLLAQERPGQAYAYLLDAFRRDTQMFAGSRSELGRYFGDAAEDGTSKLLSDQMRRYVELGMYNQDSWRARLLEAYCAWRQGEVTRAREAARLCQELARAQIQEVLDVPRRDAVFGSGAGAPSSDTTRKPSLLENVLAMTDALMQAP